MKHSDLDAIRQAHLCQFKGQGCAKEDDCQKSAQDAKHCPLYAYFNFLTKEELKP